MKDEIRAFAAGEKSAWFGLALPSGFHELLSFVQSCSGLSGSIELMERQGLEGERARPVVTGRKAVQDSFETRQRLGDPAQAEL